MNRSKFVRALSGLLLAGACAGLATTAAAGQRLGAGALKPAPTFDAGDGVPGPGDWALGPGMATTVPFDVRYTFEGQSRALADFPARTDTTGLLILKGNQIMFEGYYQGAD